MTARAKVWTATSSDYVLSAANNGEFSIFTSADTPAGTYKITIGVRLFQNQLCPPTGNVAYQVSAQNVFELTVVSAPAQQQLKQQPVEQLQQQSGGPICGAECWVVAPDQGIMWLTWKGSGPYHGVQALAGQVAVQPDGRIVTGPNAKAVIYFGSTDGSMIELDQNTAFTFMDVAPEGQGFLTEFEFGKMFFNLIKCGQTSPCYAVETPNVWSAVRGTMIWRRTDHGT
jgi:hypothetical protein